MAGPSWFAGLEERSREYASAKASRDPNRGRLADQLIDMISSQDFVLPLKPQALSNMGTTTYVYEQEAGYPATFAFIAEVLNSKVPVHVGATKFGPGEVIVASGQKEDADGELARDVNHLRELVHARKSRASSQSAEPS
ncbi:MAG: hypothetical protein ABI361_10305 [Nitrososphaera sp.]|jgi:hypothetical protein